MTAGVLVDISLGGRPLVSQDGTCTAPGTSSRRCRIPQMMEEPI